MSGAEIIYRDSKQRTIVVWGDVVNMSSGLGRRMMFEIPQGVIKYETTKPEIFERLAIDNYKIIFVNGCLSNIKDAIFAIKSSKEPFVVTQDDYGILIVKSTTEDGYADIVVELRY